MIAAAGLALYFTIGAVWALCLDAERHRNADAIQDTDPEGAIFECRWGWVRHFLLWPVYAIGGLCHMVAVVLKAVR